MNAAALFLAGVLTGLGAALALGRLLNADVEGSEWLLFEGGDDDA